MVATWFAFENYVICVQSQRRVPIINSLRCTQYDFQDLLFSLIYITWEAISNSFTFQVSVITFVYYVSLFNSKTLLLFELNEEHI
jgi:hypothetical protein